jgi:hypothetical protein
MVRNQTLSSFSCAVPLTFFRPSMIRAIRLRTLAALLFRSVPLAVNIAIVRNNELLHA